MKILVLGDDSRTHALAWKLFNSDSAREVVCAPGNGGTSLLMPSADAPRGSARELCHWAFHEGFQLIVPGAVDDLAAGLADEAARLRMPVLGSPQATALLECSRLRAKEFLLRHQIPTPRGRSFSEIQLAEKYIAGQPLPLVVRGDIPLEVDGVYAERYAVMGALEEIFATPLGEGNSRGVIVEEHVAGPHIAFSALTDGKVLRGLLPVRIYDRRHAGDQGPNAPGMGAHSENRLLAERLQRYLELRILEPLLAALHADGLTVRGLLGIDCVLGPQGPLVTGLRSTWADMEAQVVLPRLEDDLGILFQASVTGTLAQQPELRWRQQAGVALSMVSEGYPGHGQPWVPLSGLSDLDLGVLAFHHQTERQGGMRYLSHQEASVSRGLISSLTNSWTKAMTSAPSGDQRDLMAGFTTSGPRPLVLVALGNSLAEARARLYQSTARVQFQSCSYRADIGEKGL